MCKRGEHDEHVGHSAPFRPAADKTYGQVHHQVADGVARVGEPEKLHTQHAADKLDRHVVQVVRAADRCVQRRRLFKAGARFGHAIRDGAEARALPAATQGEGRTTRPLGFMS